MNVETLLDIACVLSYPKGEVLIFEKNGEVYTCTIRGKKTRCYYVSRELWDSLRNLVKIMLDKNNL